MERLCYNMSIVVMKDWIKPLTRNLNSQQNLSLTEEYMVSLIHMDDVKHTPKSKRLSKPTSNVLFQVRNYPNSIDLVKLPNHERLYLLGKSIVVYASAQMCAEDGTALEEFEHCDGGYRPEGIPNPEIELGYTFDTKLIAVGSLVNNEVTYLTDEDMQLCESMGIYTELAGKIKRADKRTDRETCAHDAAQGKPSDVAFANATSDGKGAVHTSGRKRSNASASLCESKKHCPHSVSCEKFVPDM